MHVIYLTTIIVSKKQFPKLAVEHSNSLFEHVTDKKIISTYQHDGCIWVIIIFILKLHVLQTLKTSDHV